MIRSSQPGRDAGNEAEAGRLAPEFTNSIVSLWPFAGFSPALAVNSLCALSKSSLYPQLGKFETFHMSGDNELEY